MPVNETVLCDVCCKIKPRVDTRYSFNPKLLKQGEKVYQCICKECLKGLENERNL